MVRAKGFLMFELLIAMALLTGLVTLIVPSIHSFETRLETRKKIIKLDELSVGIQQQLQAYFQNLIGGGCLQSPYEIEIGNFGNAPSRIHYGELDKGSDWLSGYDFGNCAFYAKQTLNVVEGALSCDGINVGDTLAVSSCYVTGQADVISTTNGHLKALTSFSHSGEVLLSPSMPFYWFVKTGKTEQNAFWRRPMLSGNALELNANIRHIRIYPIFDTDSDGAADEIRVTYGRYALDKVAGLLIELAVAQSACKEKTNSLKVFKTLRGDNWQYDNVCSTVSKAIIDMRKSL